MNDKDKKPLKNFFALSEEEQDKILKEWADAEAVISYEDDPAEGRIVSEPKPKREP